MSNIEQLKNLSGERDYFIGFDSDGCVFDTMELKHRECFCPAFIRYMGLQPVSRAAREVWDFVNLYSSTRGCNRFLAVQYACRLLAGRADVQARQAAVPECRELCAWIERETKLGNPALTEEVKRSGNEELASLLRWSEDVNKRVAEMVSGITPFSCVVDVLKAGRGRADMMVVSQTPFEALAREWDENGMSAYVDSIAGQEHGTKAEQIRFATEDKGYENEKILMVGDAPGDYQAAMDNAALFYPIIPGDEEHSWARLKAEGLERFFNGTFAGAYQQKLSAEFHAALPETPPWDR